MPIEKQIQQRAEEIEKDIETKSVGHEYQYTANVCIFRKLAELELKIEEMQNWKENNYI